MLATVNSTKHIINHSALAVATGAITNLIEINAVALSAVSASVDVRSGSVIKAIHIELWILGLGAAEPATYNLTVEKAKGGQPNMTFAQAVSLMAYPNKANILFTAQGFVGDDTNNAIPVLREWVPIPKGKQRFALGDELRINIAGITGVQVCGVSIYKEYY